MLVAVQSHIVLVGLCTSLGSFFFALVTAAFQDAIQRHQAELHTPNVIWSAMELGAMPIAALLPMTLCDAGICRWRTIMIGTPATGFLGVALVLIFHRAALRSVIRAELHHTGENAERPGHNAGAD
jgi:hypothetical protein